MTTSQSDTPASSAVSARVAVAAAKDLLREHGKTLDLLRGYRNDLTRRGSIHQDFALAGRHLHRMAENIKDFIDRYQEIETWVG